MDKNFIRKKRPGTRTPSVLPGRMERTARRGRMWDLCAVLLFLLLLPYACSLLFGGKTDRQTVQLPEEEGERMVLLEEHAGEIRLPMEAYVEGALAASISAASEKETLKAQVIILRTLAQKAWEERKDTSVNWVRAEEIGQSYLDMEERRELWGEAFEENQDAIASAVSETQGMVLIKDGNLLEPAYFRLSAGRTRDGLEVLGEGYEYLVSVDCSHDVEDASYSNSVVVEKDAFWDALGSAAEGKVTLVRDSADYVLYVEYGETAISGEAFRSLFGLPSSCFTIKEENGRIVLNSFGVGHGLGFCQSEANRRAKEGEDYLALLKIFFEGAQIQKI